MMVTRTLLVAMKGVLKTFKTAFGGCQSTFLAEINIEKEENVIMWVKKLIFTQSTLILGVVINF